MRGGGLIADADDASRAINKAGALESRDGSYRLVSNSAETPASSDGTSRGRWVGLRRGNRVRREVITWI
ncbi:MAG: hypothetical protein ACLTDR_11720 [Adlercreutzia equolifaciens]